MKKLYKLKKWLTIDEAAQRLSIELGEEVTKADILQLAVEEQLRMSVYIPHDWEGKICDITTDKEKADSEYTDVVTSEYGVLRFYKYSKCRDSQFIKVNPEVFCVRAGIYELTMIGQEKLDLEYDLRESLNLEQSLVYSLDGFYVQTANGTVIEIQTEFDTKELINENLNTAVMKSISTITNDECILHRSPYTGSSFYPCPTINGIEGAFWCIQSAHIEEFLASLDDESANINNKLNVDNALILLGEVLQVVKSDRRKWTQGEIIDKILEKRQNENATVKGLEQRTIEEYFSNANKRLKP